MGEDLRSRAVDAEMAGRLARREYEDAQRNLVGALRARCESERALLAAEEPEESLFEDWLSADAAVARAAARLRGES